MTMLHDDVKTHLDVLGEAWQIFQEKNELRGDMWRDFPPSDKLREVRERCHRMERTYEQFKFELPPEGPEDPYKTFRGAAINDALDTINYLVFFIRQLREGQRG